MTKIDYDWEVIVDDESGDEFDKNDYETKEDLEIHISNYIQSYKQLPHQGLKFACKTWDSARVEYCTIDCFNKIYYVTVSFNK